MWKNNISRKMKLRMYCIQRYIPTLKYRHHKDWDLT